ncbi:hypothetical protein 4L372X_018 [Aeromonas phage 4_L372X]|nr:hypothetical protein 4L372X_018 [Aeromonas phage 4_L372X]
MKLSKSKLALAKVINENGGWRNGAKSAAQCKSDMTISFYRDAPCRNGDYWLGDYIHEADVKVSKLSNNWHQTYLSSEEYYHAYPNADADGWIEWYGGECPVGDFDEVQVKYKVDDGSGMCWCEAKELYWHHEDADCDIVAYRLHKPEVKPDFCESVTRSISGPESRPTIEQLAQDYRNKLDFANRKRDEAESASSAASSALSLLRSACKEFGLDVSPSVDAKDKLKSILNS